MTSGSPSNVLFVVMDTVRKDRLGPYGYDRDTTPGLDGFADEATVFENAVAPAPWTLPVHTSIFTGMYPSRHGADQENPYLEGATTLAQSLSADGTRTACYSSNAWITPYTHLTDGFDDQDNFFEVMPGDLLSGPLARMWQVLNDNPRLRKLADMIVSAGNTAHEYLSSGEGADSKTPRVMDRTKQFIEESEADGEDWFSFINLMDAHLPYHPPEEFQEEFAPGVDSSEVCQNSKEFNSGARDIDDAEWDDIKSLYDAEIAHIDSQLTRLFDWLKETDRWEDTAVVVCADHGELHGEHDLYGHEFGLYDPIVNVPLLVKHPSLDAERREDTVELLDLYHTVLDTFDTDATPMAADEEAVSLDPMRSLLSESYRDFDEVDDPDPAQQAAPDGETGFIEYSRPVVELKQLEEKAADAGIELDEDSRFYARMRAARRADAKYVRIDRIEDEAYRLDEDPDETENLVGEGDETVEEVESELAVFESEIGGAWTSAAASEVTDEAVEEMDEEIQDRLQDLGYME
ncbi:sulfatase [Halolamina salifodinae]|uniref:Arylsulfatase A-like enzyme n=1 Tax=Halolamina salifodinae TaxID=1202767 RepID=A0A8T4GZE5_9EURY|nr:sulfatase [Halolamina salifodinae]MBP1988361.1 arylsulfatase A-like enzyme [Halolamina salifodinae]